METSIAQRIADLMTKKKKLLTDRERLKNERIAIYISIFLRDSMWLHKEPLNYGDYEITESELREFLLSNINRKIREIDYDIEKI